MAAAAALSKTIGTRAPFTASVSGKVQEEERRAIARDLHDDFGQSLAATTALAAVIENSAMPSRPDIVQDARAITKTQEHMMGALRSTLVRLHALPRGLGVRCVEPAFRVHQLPSKNGRPARRLKSPRATSIAAPLFVVAPLDTAPRESRDLFAIVSCNDRVASSRAQEDSRDR